MTLHKLKQLLQHTLTHAEESVAVAEHKIEDARAELQEAQLLMKQIKWVQGEEDATHN